MKSIIFTFSLLLAMPVFAQKSKKHKVTIPKPEIFATVDGAVGNIAFTPRSQRGGF